MLPQTPQLNNFSPGLISSDSLVERLTAIFNYKWQFLLKEANEWRTETRHPLKPNALWQLWKDARTFVGVRFGKLTRYGLIDIDIDSPYHPNQDPSAIPAIVSALESIGIYRVLIIRSSDSNGIHIYVPLETPISTYGLATALKFCCEDAGFPLAPGKLEIFPNCKAYRAEGHTNYNGHRLPLQAGSYLLNDDYEPITNDLGFFLKVWDMSASGNSNQELEAEIARNKQRSSTYTKGGKGSQWRADCEAAINQGWTGHGQTNELLGTFAQYGRVFLSLEGEELVQWMISTAIAAPGYKQWCQHQHHIESRCREWAKQSEGYYFPYPTIISHSRKSPWRKKSNANDEKSANATERIKAAYEALKNADFTKQTDLLNAIAAAAKCSLSTLYKNRSIWQSQTIVETECVIAEKPCIEPDTGDHPEYPPNTPEPLPDKELHTKAPKKVIEPVGISDRARTSEKTNSDPSNSPVVSSPTSPTTAFAFDFCDRTPLEMEARTPENLAAMGLHPPKGVNLSTETKPP